MLELLISIVILLLIMVPLMNNFIRSAKINEGAEKLQDYSDVASNVLEDIKSGELAQILRTYGGTWTDSALCFGLLPGTGGAYEAHEYDHVADINNDKFWFGLVESGSDSKKYDVLVSIDANSVYKLSPSPGATVQMNNFEMPDISVMDDLVNGMFFSELWRDATTKLPVTTAGGRKSLYQAVLSPPPTPLAGGAFTPDYENLDRVAVNYFLDKADAYADAQYKAYYDTQYQAAYEEAVRDGITPAPYPNPVPDRLTSSVSAYSNPEYCKTGNLLRWITRTTRLEINSLGTAGTKISYTVTYHCAWQGVALEDTYEVVTEREYSTLINNVYFYYQPSIFQQYHLDYYYSPSGTYRDIIDLTNNTGRTVNLYLVRLTKGTTARVDITEITDDAGHTNMIYVPLKTDKCEEFVETDLIYDPAITIEKYYTGTDNLNIYSNLDQDNILEYVNGTLSAAPGINEELVESSAGNRIYSVTVQVFRYSDALEDKYASDNLLYTLDSNRDK